MKPTLGVEPSSRLTDSEEQGTPCTAKVSGVG